MNISKCNDEANNCTVFCIWQFVSVFFIEVKIIYIESYTHIYNTYFLQHATYMQWGSDYPTIRLSSNCFRNYHKNNVFFQKKT